MSIMRSFTTRRKQPELDPDTPSFLGRAASQRAGRPVPRAQISSPVALVSTTNVLSYNAPDIAGTQPIEHRDLNSGSSSEESDGSAGSVHSHDTDPTDASSTSSSPISAEPDANHLSKYFFKAAVDAAAAANKVTRSASNASRSPYLTESPSPALPRRAPSHSKRAHEALSQKLSVQRARSPSVQGRSVSHIRSSADMFNSMATSLEEAPREAPFGKELAQLDAVAEEFDASRSRLTEEEFDAQYLRSKGLAHVSANDYLSEIDSLKFAYLNDSPPAVTNFSEWF